MSTQVDRAEVQLGVVSDLSGIGEFLAGLSIVPEAVEEIFGALRASQLGSTPEFAARGRDLARALISGVQAELAGATIGGDGLAGTLARQLLGANAASEAYASNLRLISGLLEDLRGRQLPALTQPQFTASAVQGLQSAINAASAGSAALREFNAQLAATEERLNRLRSLAIPQGGGAGERLLRVEQTPQGPRAALRPALRNQLEAAGLNPQRLEDQIIPSLLTSRGGIGGGTNLSASSRALGQVLAEVQRQQIAEYQQAFIQTSRASITTAAQIQPSRALVPTGVVTQSPDLERRLVRLNRIVDALERVGQLGEISFNPLTGLPRATRVPAVLPGRNTDRGPDIPESQVRAITRQTNFEILQANSIRRGAQDGYLTSLSRAGDGVGPDDLNSVLRQTSLRRRPNAEGLVEQRVDSFEQMMLGKGLSNRDARRLTQEQLTALAGYTLQPNELKGTGRFFPAGLVDTERIRAELEAGRPEGPIALPAGPVGLLQQQRARERAERAAAIEQRAAAREQERLLEAGVRSYQSREEGPFRGSGLRPESQFRQSIEASTALLRGEAAQAAPEVRAMAQAIREAGQNAPALYRGLTGSFAEQLIRQARDGGGFLDLPFQGFSSKQSIAENFLTGNPVGGKYPLPLTLELEPGARALDFSRFSDERFTSESEFVTGGRFKVVSQRPDLETEAAGGIGAQIIRLRQLSLAEEQASRTLQSVLGTQQRQITAGGGSRNLPVPFVSGADRLAIEAQLNARGAAFARLSSLPFATPLGPVDDPSRLEALRRARQARLEAQLPPLVNLPPPTFASKAETFAFTLGRNGNRLDPTTLAGGLEALGAKPSEIFSGRGDNRGVRPEVLAAYEAALEYAAERARLVAEREEIVARILSGRAEAEQAATAAALRSAQAQAVANANRQLTAGPQRLQLTAAEARANQLALTGGGGRGGFGGSGAFGGGGGGAGGGAGSSGGRGRPFAGGAGGAGGTPPPPPPPSSPFPDQEPGRQGRAPFANFRQNFGEGLFGKNDGDLARQLGQTVKFSVLYGSAYAVLFQFVQALQAGVQGAIQFEDGLAQLNLVTGRGGRSNENLANDLVNVGAGAGVGVGDAVNAGARAIGLFDVVGASLEEQARVAKESVEVAGRVAFVTGQAVELVQTQIAGVTRSFPGTTQTQVEDITAFAGKQSGRNPGDILAALGQIGSLGADAGFDAATVAAIIARVTSTTGQSPQAVSGFLSQILSKADDPNAERALRGVGVNTSGTNLAEQLQQLSELNLPQNQLNQVIQQFGRGRSGQALGIVLDQFPQIQGLAAGARDANGEGKKAFDATANTVGGQLRLLGAELKNLAASLAETGLFDFFALLIKGALELTRALDALVDVFNLIPRPIRTAALGLIELYAALRLLASLRAASQLVALFTGSRAAGVVGRAIPGLINSVPTAAAVRGFFGQSAGAAAGQAVGAGAGALASTRALLARRLFAREAVEGAEVFAANTTLRGAAGGIAGSAAAPALGTFGAVAGRAGIAVGTLAAGAAVAVGGLLGLKTALDEARESARAEQRANVLAATAKTPDELRNAAKAQRDAADKLQENRQVGFGSIFKLFIPEIVASLTNRDNEENLRRNAADSEAAAKDLEEAKRQAGNSGSAAVFDNFTTSNSVAEGLEQLKNSGASVTTQIQLLTGAFRQLVDAAALARTGVRSGPLLLQGQGDIFAQQVAGGATAGVASGADLLDDIAQALDPVGNDRVGIGGRILGSIGELVVDPLDSLKGAFAPILPGKQDSEKSNDINKAADELRQKLNSGEARQNISQGVIDYLNAQGKSPQNGPVALTAQDEQAITDIAIQNLGIDLSQYDQPVQDAVRGAIVQSIKQSLAAYKPTKITPEQVQQFVQATIQNAPAVGQEAALRSGQNSDAATAALASLQEGRALASQALSGLLADAGSDPNKIAKAYEQYNLGLQQIDLAILQTTKQQVEDRKAAIGAQAQLAASNRNLDDTVGRANDEIAGLQGQLGLTTDAGERAALQAQINDATKRQFQDALTAVQSNAVAAIDPRERGKRLAQERGNLLQTRETLTPGSKAFADNTEALANNAIAQQQYAVDVANAQSEANIATQPSALNRARLALNNATNDLLVLKQGTPEYYRALAAQTAARLDLAEQTRQQRLSARALQVTPGNSNEAAQFDLESAQSDFSAAQAKFGVGSTEANEAQRRVNEAAFRRRQLAADTAAARRASATDPRNDLGRARNAVADARDALALTEAGSLEYYKALEQLHQAQQSLAELERTRARNLRRLGTDLTDPVAQARQDVLDAQEALNQAKASGGDTSQAQLDLRNAQNNEEAQAFQQRFNDAQTAEQLGRISHQAYIDYLNGEHDRLTAIVDRTRQQQEELDQVDQALQAAKEQLQGQFNIGDIKIPTIYEVRRSISTQNAGIGYQDNKVVTINIDGGDLAAVSAAVQEQLGTSVQTAQLRTATRRSKVG